LLAKYPAPKHARKTWKQAVGESTPEDTLRLQFDRLNAQHLARQKIASKDFFATVEKNPLTDEQIHACVCMDDAVTAGPACKPPTSADEGYRPTGKTVASGLPPKRPHRHVRPDIGHGHHAVPLPG